MAAPATSEALPATAGETEAKPAATALLVEVDLEFPSTLARNVAGKAVSVTNDVIVHEFKMCQSAAETTLISTRGQRMKDSFKQSKYGGHDLLSRSNKENNVKNSVKNMVKNHSKLSDGNSEAILV